MKEKFRKLHSIVVENVDVGGIIDFLFQQGVLGVEEMSKLQQGQDGLQAQQQQQYQCRHLLMLLHSSQHPLAFVCLYRAVKNDPYLHWLVDCIDEFGELQQQHVREPAGKCQPSELSRLLTVTYTPSVF